MSSLRRRRDFELGRHAAHCAVGALFAAHDVRRDRIASGVFDQPVLEGPAAARLDVTLSHSGGLAAAVAFPRGHPLGLDLERLDPDRAAPLAAYASAAEQSLVDDLGLDELQAVTRLWTAKEALSKVAAHRPDRSARALRDRIRPRQR